MLLPAWKLRFLGTSSIATRQRDGFRRSMAVRHAIGRRPRGKQSFRSQGAFPKRFANFGNERKIAGYDRYTAAAFFVSAAPRRKAAQQRTHSKTPAPDHSFPRSQAPAWEWPCPGCSCILDAAAGEAGASQTGAFPSWSLGTRGTRGMTAGRERIRVCFRSALAPLDVERVPPCGRRPRCRGGNWVLDVGCWMLGVGCWMLGVGCWVLDVGCWMLGVGCWVLDVGCWMLDVGCFGAGTSERIVTHHQRKCLDPREVGSNGAGIC